MAKATKKKATKSATAAAARKAKTAKKASAPPARAPSAAAAKAEIFCIEYIKDFNGTRAAIAAGYSPASARFEQSRLRRKPEVSARIEQLMAERAGELQIDAKAVLARLWEISTVDIADFYDEHGAMLKVHEMPASTRRAIHSLDVEDIQIHGVKVGEIKKLKLESKLTALREVGRHLGMFQDKLDLSGSVQNLTDEQIDAKIAAYHAKMGK